jgi:hypothetical protein
LVRFGRDEGQICAPQGPGRLEALMTKVSPHQAVHPWSLGAWCYAIKAEP